MASPAAALGDEVLFGSGMDGRFGHVISQDFTAAGGIAADELDSYDSRAADDFEVPANTTWRVRQVIAGGNFYRAVKVQGSPYHSYSVDTSTSNSFNGAADMPVKVRVTIHADAGGRPGAVLRTDTNGQTCGTARAWGSWSMLTGEERICRGWHGMLATRFETPLALGPGRYWVSFQVETDPRIQGEWFWGRTRYTDWRCPESWRGCYQRAHWQNPGGGYKTACTSQWGPVIECTANFRSPRCAAAFRGVTVSTPVCEERQPKYWAWGEDLEMFVTGAATTTSKR